MAKGGSFENEIGRDLSLMWSKGTNKGLCRRTESSGGRFTSARKTKANDVSLFQGGDLTFSDPSIKPLFELFSIECKTGYAERRRGGELVRWDILDLFDGRKEIPVIEKMWAQCIKDAKLTNRIPWLIFRRNQRKPCTMMEQSTFRGFTNYHGTFTDQRILYNPGGGAEEHLVVVAWSDFRLYVGDNLEFITKQWYGPPRSEADG